MKEFYGCWSPQNEEMYRSVKALRNIALMGGLFATLSLTSLTLSSSLLPLSSFISCFLTLTVALPIQNIPYLPSLLFSSSHSDIYFSPWKSLFRLYPFDRLDEPCYLSPTATSGSFSTPFGFPQYCIFNLDGVPFYKLVLFSNVLWLRALTKALLYYCNCRVISNLSSPNFLCSTFSKTFYF